MSTSDTPPPRTGSGEIETLRGFLDYLRASIAAKVDGAPEPQVRTVAVPSGTKCSTAIPIWVHRSRGRGRDAPLPASAGRSST